MSVETPRIVRVIPDPYTDYTPPDHLRDFVEERRVTREVIGIIAELDSYDLRDLIKDDGLVIPADVPEDLRGRIERHWPFLRWASGKEANAWLAGGPANVPHTPGPNVPDVRDGRQGGRDADHNGRVRHDR